MISDDEFSKNEKHDSYFRKVIKYYYEVKDKKSKYNMCVNYKLTIQNTL